MMTKEEKSLDQALGGPTQRVMVKGKEVEISPMKMRSLVAFAKAIKPIRAELAAISDELTFQNLADLLATGTDLFDAVEAACGVQRAELEELDLAEFIELAATVLSVNADFFVKRVAPALKTAVTGST